MDEIPHNQRPTEIDQIESIAETKGIEIDDIEVLEGTTDDGDRIYTFRIFETRGESMDDSVAIQVSKIPSTPQADMTFRNELQRKYNSLKDYVTGDESVTEPNPIEADEQVESATNDATAGTDEIDLSNETVDSPEHELAQRRQRLEQQVEQLDQRVSELEEYIDALEGVKKLMGDNNDD
jgi:hypothetical protein